MSRSREERNYIEAVTELGRIAWAIGYPIVAQGSQKEVDAVEATTVGLQAMKVYEDYIGFMVGRPSIQQILETPHETDGEMNET